MRPHSAQALAHTLTLLLALAGAVGHGVFLSALIDLDANVFGSTLGIVTVVEIAWLVILALYLISTSVGLKRLRDFGLLEPGASADRRMLAPKNARFIWVITDVCLLLAFAAVGLGATIALVIANYVHLDACHKKYGEPCSASVGGGAVSFVVVVIVSVSLLFRLSRPTLSPVSLDLHPAPPSASCLPSLQCLVLLGNGPIATATLPPPLSQFTSPISSSHRPFGVPQTPCIPP